MPHPINKEKAREGYAYLNKIRGEIKMKEMFKEEMKEFGVKVANDLGIEIPAVTYVTGVDFRGFTVIPVVSSIFGVQSISRAVEIQFSIDEHLIFAPGVSEKYKRAVIRQIISHELRHVWQSIYDHQLVIKQLNDQSIVSHKGYGMQVAELDANEYAMSMAGGSYEKDVFKSLRIADELVGCVVPDRKKIKELNKLNRKTSRQRVTKEKVIYAVTAVVGLLIGLSI